MPLHPRGLLVLLLLAGPLVADEPPFSTELRIGFGYEGSSAERPVVVLDGAPSTAYEYSADGRAHTVEIAATRWFSPVPDDGWTPLALLPYVSLASSLSARYALSGASRDSLGSLSGQGTSLEVSLAGDGTLRDGGLAAEWFLGRDLAVRGGLAYGNVRETAASTSVERPSGRADVSTSATRGSSVTGSVGVALRLGEHEVRVDGLYGETDRTRDDASAFTGSAQPFFSSLSTDGITRTGTVAARLLFLERRLAVDASGHYAYTTSSSDLESASPGPFSKGSAIGRFASVEATWYATRRVGLSAGFAYSTSDASSGAPGRVRPSSDATTRVLALRAGWFASDGISVALSGEWVETDTVAPPGSTTYQRFEESTGRVKLGAGLRF